MFPKCPPGVGEWWVGGCKVGVEQSGKDGSGSRYILKYILNNYF